MTLNILMQELPLRAHSGGLVHFLTSEERCMLVKPVGIGFLAPLLESLSCARFAARGVGAAYSSSQPAVSRP